MSTLKMLKNSSDGKLKKDEIVSVPWLQGQDLINEGFAEWLDLGTNMKKPPVRPTPRGKKKETDPPARAGEKD